MENANVVLCCRSRLSVVVYFGLGGQRRKAAVLFFVVPSRHSLAPQLKNTIAPNVLIMEEGEDYDCME